MPDTRRPKSPRTVWVASTIFAIGMAVSEMANTRTERVTDSVSILLKFQLTLLTLPDSSNDIVCEKIFLHRNTQQVITQQ